MTARGVVEPRHLGERPRARTPGVGLLVVGAVATCYSLATLSWYTISGPNVITNPSDLSESARVPLFLADPHPGLRHSIGVWIIVTGCVLAAIAAQCASYRTRMRFVVATLVLGAIGILDVVERIGSLKLAAGERALPPGTQIHVHVGAWIAIAGLVTLAGSALVRRDPQGVRGSAVVT